MFVVVRVSKERAQTKHLLILTFSNLFTDTDFVIFSKLSIFYPKFFLNRLLQISCKWERVKLVKYILIFFL